LGSQSLKGYLNPKQHERVGLRYDFKYSEFGRLIESDDLIEISVKFYDLYEEKMHFRRKSESTYTTKMVIFLRS
jgi:hypothetical protein